MVLVPDNYVDKAIVYHHGVGEDEGALLDDALKADVVARLLSDGYLLAGSNAAGENWGNQASLDAYAALDTYLTNNYAPTKKAIFSQSMGGCSGLNVAHQRAADLVAWFGIVPVCSLSNMFGNNGGTFAPDIRTAFGIAANGSDYATKTSGYDPNTLSAAAWATLPMRFYVSTDDTVVTKAGNTDALRAQITTKRECDLLTTTGGHGATGNFRPQDVSDFLNRAFVTRTAAWRSL